VQSATNYSPSKLYFDVSRQLRVVYGKVEGCMMMFLINLII